MPCPWQLILKDPQKVQHDEEGDGHAYGPEQEGSQLHVSSSWLPGKRAVAQKVSMLRSLSWLETSGAPNVLIAQPQGFNPKDET